MRGAPEGRRRAAGFARWLPAAALAWAGACGGGNPVGPSPILGDWVGHNPPGHAANIELRFEQRGSAIVGTSCAYDYPYLHWRDVPVTVAGPIITFTIRPGTPDARTFVGRFSFDGSSLTGKFAGDTTPKVVFFRGGSQCASVPVG